MGEYFTDVVAAGGENSEGRITCRALERAACQSAIGFHMSYLGFDSAAGSVMNFVYLGWPMRVSDTVTR